MASGELALVTAGVTTSNPFDRQVAAFRAALAGADTFTTAAILATPTFTLGLGPEQRLHRDEAGHRDAQRRQRRQGHRAIRKTARRQPHRPA